MIEEKSLLTIISELHEDYWKWLSKKGIDSRDASHPMARKYQRLLEIWADVSYKKCQLEWEMKDKYLREVLDLRKNVRC